MRMKEELGAAAAAVRRSNVRDDTERVTSGLDISTIGE